MGSEKKEITATSAEKTYFDSMKKTQIINSNTKDNRPFTMSLRMKSRRVHLGL